MLHLSMFVLVPTLWLWMLTLTVAWITAIVLRKKKRLQWSISLVVGILFYLSLNDVFTKMQAEQLVGDVFDYKEKHGIVPNSLAELQLGYLMLTTPSFSEFQYQRRNETSNGYEWKLSYTTIWGTYFYYDDKCGEMEESEEQDQDLHWNHFNKIRDFQRK